MKQEDQIIQQALAILAARANRGEKFSSPESAGRYLQLKLGERESEAFVVLFLNSQYALIECREMFYGTIDGATVYPREVARAALELNAAAVIFGHNHPSDTNEPSTADKRITDRLVEVLDLFEIRVLDHFVVSRSGFTSFAERGLI